jgi:hypothetical protein
MEELNDKMYGWVRDYLPEEESQQLTGLVSHVAREYGRAMMGLGVFVGFILGALVVAWAS